MGWTFPHPNGSLGFLSQPLFSQKLFYFPLPQREEQGFLILGTRMGYNNISWEVISLLLSHSSWTSQKLRWINSGMGIPFSCRRFLSCSAGRWDGKDGECKPQELRGFGSALRLHLAWSSVLLKPGYSDFPSPCYWKIPGSCYLVFSPSVPQRNPWIPSPSPKVPTDKQMYCKRDTAAKTLLFYFELSLVELSSY